MQFGRYVTLRLGKLLFLLAGMYSVFSSIQDRIYSKDRDGRFLRNVDSHCSFPRRIYNGEDARSSCQVKTADSATICDKGSAAKSPVVLYRSADDG